MQTWAELNQLYHEKKDIQYLTKEIKYYSSRVTNSLDNLEASLFFSNFWYFVIASAIITHVVRHW